MSPGLLGDNKPTLVSEVGFKPTPPLRDQNLKYAEIRPEAIVSKYIAVIYWLSKI